MNIDKSLAEEYKDIMMKWGSSRLNAVEEANACGRIKEGYTDLRDIIVKKSEQIANTDAEILLMDKVRRTIEDSNVEIQACKEAIDSGELDEKGVEYCTALKEMREKFLAMSDKDRQREVVNTARAMYEAGENI